jgi:hypothetical protein
MLPDPLRLGRRQVDLVEDDDDLVVRLDRLVGVGERLRLDPLARVDHQQRALARGEAAAHLVGEIDMPRRVDEVEGIGPAVARDVLEPHRLRLDRDPALALDVHGVEHLGSHLARAQPPAALDQAVGERRLAVVDMGDDREVADLREVGHRRAAAALTPSARRRSPCGPGR